MSDSDKQLRSGNEAIALAAAHASVKMGTGYPGTPSTEILETLAGFGDKTILARWAPNEKVALEAEGTSPNYQIIADRHDALDTMEVRIEVTEATLSDEMKNLHLLRENIENRLADALSLTPKVTPVEPGALPRSEGKAVRVIDKRKE